MCICINIGRYICIRAWGENFTRTCDKRAADKCASCDEGIIVALENLEIVIIFLNRAAAKCVNIV